MLGHCAPVAEKSTVFGELRRIIYLGGNFIDISY